MTNAFHLFEIRRGSGKLLFWKEGPMKDDLMLFPGACWPPHRDLVVAIAREAERLRQA